MDKVDSIIDAIINAEGGSKFTDDSRDGGGRTQYGISEKSNPEAWVDGKVTSDEARAIYRRKYVEQPGFDKLDDPKLTHFMVDFGVTSGPNLAIQYLQRTLDVQVDGILGPATLLRANGSEPGRLLMKMVIARVKMIGRIVQKSPSQAKYLVGWMNRCFEFLEET